MGCCCFHVIWYCLPSLWPGPHWQTAPFVIRLEDGAMCPLGSNQVLSLFNDLVPADTVKMAGKKGRGLISLCICAANHVCRYLCLPGEPCLKVNPAVCVQLGKCVDVCICLVTSLPQGTHVLPPSPSCVYRCIHLPGDSPWNPYSGAHLQGCPK